MDLGSSSALTIESIRLALGAAGLRQKAIADNIANINSTDHVRMRVIFEDKLASALSALEGMDESADAVAQLREGSTAELEVDNTQRKLELDEEVAQLSANSLRYHALTRGLSRYLSIASAIAAPGRG